MIIRVTFAYIVLWSSFSFTQEVNPKVISKSTGVFIIEPGYKYYDKENFKTILNMPKIESQDTIGNCFGCASATIAQKFLCDNDITLSKNENCSSAPLNKQISQFSMNSWAEPNDGKSNNETVSTEVNEHTNIRLYRHTNRDIFKASQALKNSALQFAFMPESCYPTDILVNKYSKNNEVFETAYYRLENLYNERKKKSSGSKSEADSICTNCLNTVKKELVDQERFPNFNISQATLNSAFLQNTFGQFLFTLLFDNCELMILQEKPTYRKLADRNKKDVEKELIAILKSNKPFLVNTLCLEIDTVNKSCSNLHSVVVSGYRKACKTADSKSPQCKYQLKLHNCWGMDWQNSKNGGWVDADKFIDNLNYGETMIKSGDISWLE